MKDFFSNSQREGYYVHYTYIMRLLRLLAIFHRVKLLLLQLEEVGLVHLLLVEGSRRGLLLRLLTLNTTSDGHRLALILLLVRDLLLHHFSLSLRWDPAWENRVRPLLTDELLDKCFHGWERHARVLLLNVGLHEGLWVNTRWKEPLLRQHHNFLLLLALLN